MSFWDEYPIIQAEMKEIEKFILASIRSRNKELTEIALELVQSGGKRLRPAFVVLSAGFSRYDREKIISLAGAIEILHTATLVHDDIIDDSKLRRGKETVYSKWGADMAVYTGDYLFTKAVMMLSKGISTERLDVVAKALKTICEGEVDQYKYKFNLSLSVVEYLKRISRKTAVLFAASCATGAYEAGCPHQVVRNLGKFGQSFGMAFQIRDDLNDFISTQRESGKPVAKDIREGVFTLPVIYALNRPHVGRKIAAILKKGIDMDNEDIDTVIDAVNSSGALEEAGRVLGKYIKRAEKSLMTLPEHANREILKDILHKLEL